MEQEQRSNISVIKVPEEKEKKCTVKNVLSLLKDKNLQIQDIEWILIE